MSLDERIAAFITRTDAKPARSKLEPYAELIRTLRQRRWTYVQIAQALLDEFAVSVHPTTVHAFVKVRAKAKKSPALPSGDTPAPFAGVVAKRPRFNLDA
jgi:transposase